MTSGTLGLQLLASASRWFSTAFTGTRLELLDDGRWRHRSLRQCSRDQGKEIAQLLTDATRRQADARSVPYAISRSMTWERTAERLHGGLSKMRARQGDWLKGDRTHRPGRDRAQPPRRRTCNWATFFFPCVTIPALFQHAVHSVPDRAPRLLRGLIIARAPIVWPAPLNNTPAKKTSVRGFDGPLCRVRPACVESRHPTISQFHGVSIETWLEDRGFRRQPWANIVGAGRVRAAQGIASPSRRRWGRRLVCRGIAGRRELFVRPRASAFTLLGLDGYCAVVPDDLRAPENPTFSCR